MVSKGYGMQLLFDAYDAKKEALDNVDVINSFLLELPEVIGMHRITEPKVIYYDGGNKPDDKGITGFVIISESHISCHTYPEKNFVTIDVYSCKNFNTKKTIQFIREKFGISSFEKKTIKRGIRFQKNA